MATGNYDANGIWQYGESDDIALFSDLLNLGQDSVSDAFTDDRSRITFIENNLEAGSTFVASSQAARDSRWGIPANAGEQIALQNSGARTVRTDLGLTEQYFGVYNSSTNPGGRDTAGWYATTRQTGLVPVKASTATFVTGSGSVNAIGQASFTGCSKVILDGVFSPNFTNYKVMIIGNFSAGAEVLLRYVYNGSENTSLVYYHQFIEATGTTISAAQSYWNNAQRIAYSNADTGGISTTSELTIYRPYVVDTTTTYTTSHRGVPPATYAQSFTGGQYSNSGWTGLSIFPGSGTFTGTISVYGFNK